MCSFSKRKLKIFNFLKSPPRTALRAGGDGLFDFCAFVVYWYFVYVFFLTSGMFSGFEALKHENLLSDSCAWSFRVVITFQWSHFGGGPPKKYDQKIFKKRFLRMCLKIFVDVVRVSGPHYRCSFAFTKFKRKNCNF